MIPDHIELEIERLMREDLRHVASCDEGWDRLLLDPVDDTYWELTFPRSEIHGGGPKLLSPVSLDLAQAKYGI
ncbi:MAG: Imm27 family immunity protein [Litoreibacter sp.]